MIAGASGGGQISSSGVAEHGVTGLILKFDKARVKIATSIMVDKDSSFTVGENLARNLMADDLKGVLVLADGIEINGDLISAGLAKILPDHVVVGGGMAADGDRFKKTLVSGNSWPQPGLAIAIGFYGESLHVDAGIGSGWQSTGKTFQITASRLNKLYDMDDRAALDIYEKHLGADEHLPMSGLRFPLSVRDPADPDHGLVRTLLGIDREVGMMTFAGNMPEGWSAELMHATKQMLVEAAGDAAIGTQETPKACILVSCIGRKLVMGESCGDELKTFLHKLGSKPAVSGFYSYGEFSTGLEGAGCKLYNQTLTAFSLRETVPAVSAAQLA